MNLIVMATQAGGIALMATEIDSKIIFNIPNGESGKRRIIYNPE